MIDISGKDVIERIARASGKIILRTDTINRIKNNEIPKGDIFTIARISAINAIKKVPDLIPFCHPIPITHINLEFKYEDINSLKVICTVKSYAQTGVEMEALTGVNVALLNIWDVVKMYEKDEAGQYPFTHITDIKVEEKIKKKLSED
ncbi:MAG: cyclic pyranopterin monophosphate synthase MoaC [Promethearchaeota archaeon]|nr:MAG: cyclic pyranopterin monophosphate synthase MoaC [Candidatus Lokiarchaeota archaeon]